MSIFQKTKITLILSLFAGSAFADSFTIIQNGQQYLCQPTAASNPSGVIDCIDTAYHGPFSREQSQDLCQAAISTAPADCAIAAYHGPFSAVDSIALCRHATTPNGPVDCATAAYHGPFSSAQSMELCSGNGSISNSDCAIKAYHGPYSTDEAVKLCKANPQLMMRTLDLMLASPEMRLKSMQLKQTLKIAPIQK